ncbi:MAG TPA: GAF domain-containing protein [Aliidiomarina sp.]|nr:GAF domain-containing protein [Aliidiomarina sp.]
MFEINQSATVGTLEQYQSLTSQLAALTAGEPDIIANLANISAVLFDQIENLNWLGFYVMKQGELVLGPFQGKVACVRIPVGQGVCGTAVATGEIQRVENVHDFAGHIACDSASESELVLPIKHHGKVVAVLDIDSPSQGRFSELDQQGMSLMLPLLESLNWDTYAK